MAWIADCQVLDYDASIPANVSDVGIDVDAAASTSIVAGYFLNDIMDSISGRLPSFLRHLQQPVDWRVLIAVKERGLCWSLESPETAALAPILRKAADP